MTVTVKKASFQKLQPRIKLFQDSAVREELFSDLLNINIEESEEGFSNFRHICKKF